MLALTRSRKTVGVAALAIVLVAAVAGAAFSAPSVRSLPGAASHPASHPQATGAGRAATLLHRADAARSAFAPRKLTLPPSSVTLSSPQSTAAKTETTSTTIGAPCSPSTEVRCAKVTVPLDRTGVVPGTIDLQVQELPALGVERGVMFLIAGGPGQGSAHVFGLLDPSQAWYYELLFPGYTLVAVDNRGTGESGLIDCPSLQTAYLIEEEIGRVKTCGDKVGPNRVFYSTRDHAEDLEAVRVALGAPKIALWGTSYGTKLAVAYALGHPGNVDRLLLDSVVPTDETDPYSGDTLREMPKSQNEFCANGRCRAATPDFAGELTAEANALAASPAQVPIVRADGQQRTVRVAGLDLLSMAVEGDLNPGIEAELPAAVHAARLGDLKPLGRLMDVFSTGLNGEAIELSSGLFAATVCADGPLPWATDAPIESRSATYETGAAALPPGSLGAFGTWAADFSNGHFCIGWPGPTGGAKLAPGPLPDVPTLAVTGGLDMRTPAVGAIAVAAKFPQGKVIIVPAVGHSVLSADPSFCAALATRQWMLAKSFETTCPRAPSLVAPVGPLTGFTKAGTLNSKQTLAAVRLTLGEAEAALNFGPPSVRGPAGGTLETDPGGILLKRYSVVPGVELTGFLAIENSDFPIGLTGTVKVTGSRAANGLLGIDRNSTVGALGGTVVG
jgi:pimeloyl-ACP methyl ester carboxylesterase